jgi:hypothetical protein
MIDDEPSSAIAADARSNASRSSSLVHVCELAT